jgi:hypothetical protein
VTTPEDPHARCARLAREYRAGGPTALLLQIGDDGQPQLAHDLAMERFSSAAAEYTARIDAFLGE